MGRRSPDRLSQERHERMEQAQVRVECLDQCPQGRLVRSGRQGGVSEPDLGQLQAPVAQLAPDRVVRDSGRLTEGVIGDRPIDRSGRGGGPAADPTLGRPQLSRVRSPAGRVGGDRRRAGPEHEAGRIPELVGEVTGPLELLWANFWSLPGEVPLIRVNRNASAPITSIASSGSTTLPVVFDIFLPIASRTMPCR